MEGLSYDCKYQNKERTLDKKEIKANAFNLLTPIIIENEKLAFRSL